MKAYQTKAPSMTMEKIEGKAPSMTMEKIEGKEMFQANKVREAMMLKSAEERQKKSCGQLQKVGRCV